MDINIPTAPYINVATLRRETLMSAKQTVNDKLQGSVATYFRCGGVASLWNDLPKSIKDIKSLRKFKEALKLHLLNSL